MKPLKELASAFQQQRTDATAHFESQYSATLCAQPMLRRPRSTPNSTSSSADDDPKAAKWKMEE
jgi:hypothetical protein